MYNPLSVADKTIVVTGASSGIGRQCAVDLARAGANVILLGRDVDRLKETADICAIGCSKVIWYSCDLQDYQKVSDVIDKAVLELGPINGLVYAAGVERTLPFNKLTEEDYLSIYRVNVVGGMNLIGILSKKKYRGDNAKYVMISSITSIIGRPGVAAYAASKGALTSAVRTLALELASKNITVNCISPGTILTPMMETILSGLSEEQIAERKSGFPLGLGTPEDISSTAMFLLSDGARWITGQNIIVDGGYTVR